ncbi:hypothetical protein D3C85_837710 [compost metagenome]
MLMVLRLFMGMMAVLKPMYETTKVSYTAAVIVYCPLKSEIVVDFDLPLMAMLTPGKGLRPSVTVPLI